MCCPNEEIRFDDLTFTIDKDVYEPAEDSILCAENLNVKEGSTVIDIGTGCGILAIVAAKKASSVLATDINPYAITCAKQNATENGLHNKISFLRSDLFNGLVVNKRFDFILFNAPYLPCSAPDESSWLEKAWAGGHEGREVIDRFLAGAPRHLKPRGEILLMQSSLSNYRKTVGALNSHGFRTEMVARKELPFFEELCLIRALAPSLV